MPRKRVTIRDHSAEANLFARRAVIALIFAAIMLSMVVSNLHYLQVTRYDDYQTRSNGNRIKILPVAPNRGLIYDRNGTLLAENRAVYTLEIIPEQVKKLDDTLARLADLLSIDEDDITEFHKELKRHRRFKPVALLNNMPHDQVALFEAHRYQFPGVSVEARLSRFYPYADILTHVLGYVGRITRKDLQKLDEAGLSATYAATHDIGKLGIEKYHEEKLHGDVGYQEVEVNSQGRIIRTLSFTPPTPGQDIVLNIDIRLQQEAHRILAGKRGSVVMLDNRTGGVLALYSNPSYDPNLFVHGISSKNYRKLLSDPDNPLFNRATQGQYPPASTIKPLLALIGLDEGVVTPQTRVFDRGTYQLNNVEHVWRDYIPWGHGWVDMSRAIEVSCDTFFYDLAYRLGIDRISDAMREFGFGDFTGVDLYEESDANMPSRGWKKARYNQPWYIGDTISVGIGQSYWTATPLQLAQAISTLVNHGSRYIPQIIKGQLIEGEVVDEPAKELPPMTIKHADNWEVILDAMRNVVSSTHGTAHKAFKDATYTSGGKTGTAQVVGIAQGEEYDAEKLAEHLRDNAMYVGFAPANHPQITIAVALENAGGGGSNAAPVAKLMMDKYFQLQQQDDEAKFATLPDVIKPMAGK